jgi:hypothetical protein
VGIVLVGNVSLDQLITVLNAFGEKLSFRRSI